MTGPVDVRALLKRCRDLLARYADVSADEPDRAEAGALVKDIDTLLSGVQQP